MCMNTLRPDGGYLTRHRDGVQRQICVSASLSKKRISWLRRGGVRIPSRPPTSFPSWAKDPVCRRENDQREVGDGRHEARVPRFVEIRRTVSMSAEDGESRGHKAEGADGAACRVYDEGAGAEILSRARDSVAACLAALLAVVNSVFRGCLRCSGPDSMWAASLLL